MSARRRPASPALLGSITTTLEHSRLHYFLVYIAIYFEFSSFKKYMGDIDLPLFITLHTELPEHIFTIILHETNMYSFLWCIHILFEIYLV